MLAPLWLGACEPEEQPTCRKTAAFVLPKPGDSLLLRGRGCPDDILGAYMSVVAEEIPDDLGITVHHVESGEDYPLIRDLMFDYASVGMVASEDLCSPGLEIVLWHEGAPGDPELQGQLSFAVQGSWPKGCGLSLEVASP